MQDNGVASAEAALAKGCRMPSKNSNAGLERHRLNAFASLTHRSHHTRIFGVKYKRGYLSGGQLDS
jgi:hypothetical protein